jgi:hypothetical protein
VAQAPSVPCKHGVRDVFCVDCFREWEGEALDEATMAVLNIERLASQIETLKGERDAANERVRVLEGALEAIDMHNRRHEDHMNSANEYTRAIRIAVIEALNPAPPTETPAPTCGALEQSHGRNWKCDENPGHDGMHYDSKRKMAWPVARDASVDARWKVFIPTTDRERMGPELYGRIAGHLSRLEGERDRLRAQLGDASVDAPDFAVDWEQAAHDRDIVIIGKDGEIDRLRAELAAEKAAHADLNTRAGEVRIVAEQRHAELAAANAKLTNVEADFDRLMRETAQLRAANAAITAKLGRAVEMINVLANHLQSAADVIADCDVLDPEDEEDQEVRDLIAAARTLANDADGTQAAEAWLELVAAYASHNQRGEDGPCECDYCKAFGALAAVDARRGGSNA